MCLVTIECGGSYLTYSMQYVAGLVDEDFEDEGTILKYATNIVLISSLAHNVALHCKKYHIRCCGDVGVVI
jgi:hypothetical protein